MGYTIDGVRKEPDLQIALSDGASLDAFSRMRVSEPAHVFDASFEYDLQPLLYEKITSGSASDVVHDATNKTAVMSFVNAGSSDAAYLQTYEFFRYQAGRSHLAMVTFNFVEPAPCTKFVGLTDGENGVILKQQGNQVSVALLSNTLKGDETVAQSDWNIDKLDGSGPSAKTIDFTKTQIFIIDLQWLGVGRVRVGFDIDGQIFYVHEFLNANHYTVPYMQTANLPIRMGMINGLTPSTTTMRGICATVISEGGQADIAGYNFAVEGSGTAGNGARTHILSVRPKTTFNGSPNRSKFILDGVDLLVTGSNPVYWELVIGQNIAASTAYNNVNSAYSGMEFNTLGTISGSPAIVIDSGYVPASATVKGSLSYTVSNKYPITLNAAGAARPNGTLSVIATGLGAGSAVRAALQWREVR